MDGRAMASMERLYESHGGALLRYLERTFGGKGSAEDLLHETFVRAMGDAGACLGAESPRAFLFGIARNVGLSAARRERLRRTEGVADVAAREGVDDGSLEEMRGAIAKLPGAVREVLEFRLREELSYEEIAAVLQIPVGTVRSRLHTAMRLLREELKD